jgi:hydroxymethylpyrimidine pyrophosphatase-like HAD family hydrolase
LDKSFGKKVSYVMTTPFSIEINALGVNKASGVQKILERADLNKQDAAAIGDSGNDVPLFKMVSLPIAVKTKNADVIRNSLVYIPKFKNGVSIAIEKYIMK